MKYLILLLYSLNVLPSSGPAPFQLSILEAHEPHIPRLMTEEKRPLSWFPNAKRYRLWKEDKNGIIYDTVVNLNNYGLRVTATLPDQLENSQDAHLIFAGCSITFGEGLQDEETFPYLISRDLRDRNVINLGLRGTGPQDHLFFWRYLKFNEIITQPKGMLIFTLIPDHFARLGRSWRYLNWAFPQSTTFVEKNNDFVFTGIIEDSWDYYLGQLIRKAGLSYWWLRLTNLHSDYLVERSVLPMARLIAKLKEAYLSQFPEGRFVVSFMRHPILSSKDNYDLFKKELTRLEIELWEPMEDYGVELKSVRDGLWHIRRDGHPTALANKLYYEFLLKRILVHNISP